MKWYYFNQKFEYETVFNDIDWPWAGHKYFAYDLIRNVKPKVIVELGTHKGTSFFSMCQAVKDGNRQTKLYAIDTWKGDKHAGLYDESIYKDVNNVKDKFYPSVRIYLIKKTFDEAIDSFKDGSIDLLHIDGLHTFDAVSHDFSNWQKKVRKNGIILLHDINEKGKDFGVYKLWNKLKRQYKTLEFFHSHGLGILFENKNKYFSNIKQLQEIWQHYYPLLHENKVICTQLKVKDKEVRETEAVKKELNQIMEENYFLKNQLRNYQIHIRNLESLLDKIKSAKFYKLWQSYCKLRDKVISKI